MTTKRKLCDNIYDKRYSEIMSRIRSTRLPETHRFYYDVLVKFGIFTGCRLLDACCGVGETISYLCKKGYTVDGFDASEGAMEIAKRNNPNSNLFVSIAEDFSKFVKTSYDSIYIVQSFHLLDDQKKAVLEVNKSLKNGGLFIFEYRNIHSVEEEGSFEDVIDGMKRKVIRTVKDGVIYSEYDYDDEGLVTHVAKMFSPFDVKEILGNNFDMLEMYGGYNFRNPRWSEDKYVIVVARKK